MNKNTLARIRILVGERYRPERALYPDVVGKVDISEALSARKPGVSLYDSIMAYVRRLGCRSFQRKNGDINEASFYKYARIEKSSWSRIRLGEVLPQKETMLKLVIALRLNEEEAEGLLAKASLSFNDTDLRDMVILSCLDVGCYDIETVYEILEEYADNGPGKPRRFKNIYADL